MVAVLVSTLQMYMILLRAHTLVGKHHYEAMHEQEVMQHQCLMMALSQHSRAGYGFVSDA